MSVDFDFEDEPDLRRLFFAINLAYVSRHVDVRRTRGGYHVRALIGSSRNPASLYLSLSAFLMDDPVRAQLNFLRQRNGVPLDVLFRYKRYGSYVSLEARASATEVLDRALRLDYWLTRPRSLLLPKRS